MSDVSLILIVQMNQHLTNALNPDANSVQQVLIADMMEIVMQNVQLSLSRLVTIPSQYVRVNLFLLFVAEVVTK